VTVLIAGCAKDKAVQSQLSSDFPHDVGNISAINVQRPDATMLHQKMLLAACRWKRGHSCSRVVCGGSVVIPYRPDRAG
jgi:hypothetical protein